MSAIDVLFIAFYCFCGMVVAGLSAAWFGTVWGVPGFFIGFILGMALWRAVHWVLTSDSAPSKEAQGPRVPEKGDQERES